MATRINWSGRECAILAREVLDNVTVVESSTADPGEKKNFWEAVTERINSVSTSHRPVGKVIKKYRDEKSQLKKRCQEAYAEARRTGAGSPTNVTSLLSGLKDWQLSIIEAQPPEFTTGIKGGTDTFTDSKTEQIPEFKGELCENDRVIYSFEVPETSASLPYHTGTMSLNSSQTSHEEEESRNNKVKNLKRKKSSREIKKEQELPSYFREDLPTFKQSITPAEFKKLPPFEREILNLNYFNAAMKRKKMENLQ